MTKQITITIDGTVHTLTAEDAVRLRDELLAEFPVPSVIVRKADTLAALSAPQPVFVSPPPSHDVNLPEVPHGPIKVWSFNQPHRQIPTNQ